MNGPRRRHIWSEFVPHDRLRTAAVLDALASRSIQLIVAAMPGGTATLPGVVAACRERGVGVAIWPMLRDRDGRWANSCNAELYCDFVTGLLAGLARVAALPDEIAIDLEPPIAAKERPLRHIWPLAREASAAARRLASLVADLGQHGLAVSCAVAPMTALASPGARHGWQRLLGTPVEVLGCDRTSAMAYTSLLEGLSRGVLRRTDARALLWHAARDAVRTFGDGASVSLGCIGTGALGDEKTYRSPAELAEDVAIARAAGVDDLALFNLGGALARPPVEAWLDALVDTRPAVRPPRSTVRARATWTVIALAGHIGRLVPTRRVAATTNR